MYRFISLCIRRTRRAFGELLLALLFFAAGTHVHAQQVGRVFPNFEAKDPISGKQFELEDFRGKVVLIDFWATWCGPCIAELPNVKNAWRKYKDDGLVIISISLDSDANKFRSFVRAQKMDWVHVMDGGGWKTRLAQKYSIRSIPRMYVLDHEGVVLSDSARGRALEFTLSEAMKKLPKAAGGSTSTKKEAQPTPGKRTRDTLRADLKSANLALDGATMPFEALARRLDSARQAAIQIKAQLPNGDQPERIRTSYLRLLDDLNAVRHELFVCGCLEEDALAVPRNPYGDEALDDRHALFAVSEEIEPALDSIARMTAALGTVRGEAESIRRDLERLDRRLARDEPVADEIAAAKQRAEQFRDDCRDAWRTRLESAGQMLQAMLGVETGARDEVDGLLQQVESCRAQLRTAASSASAQLELRDSLRSLMSRTNELADDFARSGVIEINSDQRPTNPLERGLARDVRTRLEVERELDKASDLLRRMEAAAYDPNERLRTFRAEVDSLQTMLKDGGAHVTSLMEVQERFRDLCEKLLAELDARNAS